MRSNIKKIFDFLTFPLRAITLFEEDRFGLTSLQSERYDYVSKEVKGYCIDIGCGRNNKFIKKYRKGNGIGIDVFKYEGLKTSQIIKDMTRLPYEDGKFKYATLIANINHIPKSIRAKELGEIHRILAPKGKLIITMGNPLIEIFVHKLVYIYDKLFHTNFDVDTERGMHEDEDYFLTDSEITGLIKQAKFKIIKKKYFGTQWFLNHLFVCEKSEVKAF